MSYYDLNAFEKRINKLFPFTNAEDWDNIGLQIAGTNTKIKKVLLTLDLNLQVLKYAETNKFNLIISHHPLIFKAINKIIGYKNYQSLIIKELMKSDIALLVLHTNLDRYFNKLLSKKIGLQKIKFISKNGFGSYGVLKKTLKLREFIKKVKKVLKLEHLRYIGDNNRSIKTVAAIGGSGAEYINDEIMRKVDLLITSDIKYHSAQSAQEIDLALIDAGHYFTENIMMDELKKKLDTTFKREIKFEINRICTDPIKFN